MKQLHSARLVKVGKKKTKKEGKQKHIHHLRLEGYAIKQKPQSLKALEALLLAGTLLWLIFPEYGILLLKKKWDMKTKFG